MHPRTRSTTAVRQALLAAWVASIGVHAAAQSAAPAALPALPPASLKDVFEAAWARQPEAQALPSRREAAQAHQRAAQAWTAEPPAMEARYTTDQITRNNGARELEVGIAVPLWLPNERRQAGALATADLAATESRAGAARLRLAALVRDAWWQWHRTGIDLEIARIQFASVQQLAADVARRVRAGDLARADQHQAEGAVAAAQSGLAQAEAAATSALQQIRAMTGGAVAALPAAMAIPEAEPPGGDGAGAGAAPDLAADPAPASTHSALVELQDRAAVAERAATLATTQSRANPELALSTTRDRGSAAERYGQTLTLALRIPFGGGPRHGARVATARADAAEAQAQLALARSQLQAEHASAVARVAASRAQLAAAERRASLAQETKGFFDKSFRGGQTDLPTRLRIEADAAEAERQAARSRVDLAAAVSAWRQALGLLPQ